MSPTHLQRVLYMLRAFSFLSKTEQRFKAKESQINRRGEENRPPGSEMELGNW